MEALRLSVSGKCLLFSFDIADQNIKSVYCETDQNQKSHGKPPVFSLMLSLSENLTEIPA